MNTTATVTTVTFRRLDPGAPVGLRAGACLPLRSRHTECDACVTVCPVGVLHRGEEIFSLDEGCLGCGRCATVCPTGALAVQGFAPNPDDTGATGTLAVDCRRVPAGLAPVGALRVPCLGGFSVGRLLALRLAAGERPLNLLDRGCCRNCPAGKGARHPARAALLEARAWLRQTGVPPALWPRLTRRRLPPAARPEPVGAAPTPPVRRRDFFGELARELMAEAGARSASHPAARAAVNPDRQRRSPERERRRLALGGLAARYGTTVPARFFPTVRIGDACRDHGLCAALCPTGALRVHAGDDVRGVAFDAAACIACGLCESACPEQALRLQPGGGGTADKVVVLTEHATRACADCGQTFAASDRETLCPTCRKSRAFAQAGFKALFAGAADRARRR
ncbi:MAG: 4Fe-4S binding protein [Gammaproteobacteria bacterium]|nr:4Fe-4S binding protein [Gammaproteobacteria bacterium]